MLNTLCCAGIMVFDDLKTWRLDIGDYSKYARLVVSAWQGSCRQLTDHGRRLQGIPQQHPALTHSNLMVSKNSHVSNSDLYNAL